MLEKDRVADLTANEVPELLGQSERMLTVPVVKFVSRRKKNQRAPKASEGFQLTSTHFEA